MYVCVWVMPVLTDIHSCDLLLGESMNRILAYQADCPDPGDAALLNQNSIRIRIRTWTWMWTASARRRAIICKPWSHRPHISNAVPPERACRWSRRRAGRRGACDPYSGQCPGWAAGPSAGWASVSLRTPVAAVVALEKSKSTEDKSVIWRLCTTFYSNLHTRDTDLTTWPGSSL